MSHALAVVEGNGRSIAPQAEGNFGDLWNMAEALVPTGMLPDHIKTPGAACAIILAGRELGMGPMRALRSLQLVKGKVTEAADSQLARFKSDGGRAAFETLTDTEAVLHLQHPNGDTHTERFSMEDAKRAGLTAPSSRGEPSMFTKYPKAMLRSRVITAGLKSIGWEGGAGVYDPEEAKAFSAPRLVTQDDDDAQETRRPTTPAERATSDHYDPGSASVPNEPRVSNGVIEQDAPCPKCGGKMWDNRATKTNPRAPDYKCRDKANCDGVYWPGQWPPASDEQKAAEKAQEKIDASAARNAAVFPKNFPVPHLRGQTVSAITRVQLVEALQAARTAANAKWTDLLTEALAERDAAAQTDLGVSGPVDMPSGGRVESALAPNAAPHAMPNALQDDDDDLPF